RRLAPALRAVGFMIGFGDRQGHEGSRIIRLARQGAPPPPDAPRQAASPGDERHNAAADDRDPADDADDADGLPPTNSASAGEHLSEPARAHHRSLLYGVEQDSPHAGPVAEMVPDGPAHVAEIGTTAAADAPAAGTSTPAGQGDRNSAVSRPE